jgi:Tol biopolymer transport system component
MRAQAKKRVRLGRSNLSSRDPETVPVADQTPGPAASSNVPSKLTRLDSWKGIATYLKRDVTTVRRWEKREGLPVHRHPHERRDSVYAYPTEIDDWWERRRNSIVQNGTANGGSTEEAQVSGADALAPGVSSSAWAARWAWPLAATFFATTIALGALLLTRPEIPVAEAVARQFSIFPPAGTSFRSVIVSPDGRHLAFTATSNDVPRGKTTLWVRSFDSPEARALPDTESAFLPFWSPASNALGFFADGHLWTIDLAGGSPRKVAEAPDGRGGTWNRDGTIVFAPGQGGALSRVAATGGATTTVTTLNDRERGHVWPEFLPDGQHFIYLAQAGDGDSSVFVAALDGSSRRRILSVQSRVVHSANGYLLHQRERQLVAQPFDVQRFELTGEPFTLADRAQGFHTASGILAYRTPQSPANRLVWRDRAGRSSPLANTPTDYTEPILASDDTRLAYALFDPPPSSRYGYGRFHVRGNIHVVDQAKGLTSQLTSNPEGAWGPVWSPDGRSIVFSLHRGNDVLELVQKDAADPHAAELPLITAGSKPVATSWSQDGRFLVYVTYDPGTRADIWALPMSGDRTPIPLLQSKFAEEQGQISPDGRWLAYTSHESGRSEVYITTFPKVTTKWKISSDGAGDPRWARDGKELFYIAEDRQLMAVPIKGGTTFAHGPPVALFDTGVPMFWYEARNVYDVSRDGRFLFMSPVEDDRSLPVTIVLNWAARFRK